MPAPQPSLSVIPNAAPTMARPMPWCDKRPKQHGGQALLAIVCVGETQDQRDAGHALEVVGRQLAGSVPDGATAANLVVAYEPVWAIGTGRTPTPKDVQEVHGFIRDHLSKRFNAEGGKVRILYGGSVKPSNAAELMAVPNVNGALVGGASLKAADFLANCSRSWLTVVLRGPDCRSARGGKARFDRVDTAQLQTPQTHPAAGASARTCL